MDGETALAQHRQHPVVLGPHDGLEDLDPGRCGGFRKLAEEYRAQAAALVCICDGKRELGPFRLDADIHRVADDLLGRSRKGHDAIARRVVDLDHLLC